jgi:uncharacterized protein
MKISLIDLRRDQFLFEEELDAIALELDPESFPSPLSVRVEVEEQLDGWYFQIHLSCLVPMSCFRCARLIERSFKLDDRLYVAKSDSMAATLDSDELLIVKPEQEELDLSQFLRDLLVPEVEDHFLCATDCKGLCPACGVNLNDSPCACGPKTVDSPFAGLAALRDPEEENKD